MFELSVQRLQAEGTYLEAFLMKYGQFYFHLHLKHDTPHTSWNDYFV